MSEEVKTKQEKPNSDAPKFAMIRIRMEPEEANKLKKFAEDNNMTYSDVVNKALAFYYAYPKLVSNFKK